MEKTSMSYIDYDSLKEDKLFPKSPLQFIGRIFKGTFNSFKDNLPKSLIIPILLTLLIGVFNIFYLAVIVDTFNFHDYNGVLLNKLIIYLVPGIIQTGTNLPGFTHIHNSINTLYLTMPLMYILTFILRDFFSTLFSGKKLKQSFKDTFSVHKNKYIYKELADKETSSQYIKGFIVAFIVGLIIKNPFTILLLALTFYLSFIKNNKSNMIIFLGTFIASRNIKKGKENFVNFGNIALFILGLSYGFSLYFILASILFFAFNYYIYARILFTLLFVVLFFFILLKDKMKSKKIQAIIIVLFATSFLLFINQNGYADDGGWSESGANFFNWLANAGSKVMAALGFAGSLASGIGWMANTILGSVAGFFGVAPVLQLGGLLAGFGKPPGSRSANLSFLKAALSSAFGAVGPLGDMLGNAV